MGLGVAGIGGRRARAVGGGGTGGGKNERKLEGAVVGPGGAGGNVNVRSVAGDDAGARAPGSKPKSALNAGDAPRLSIWGNAGTQGAGAGPLVRLLMIRGMATMVYTMNRAGPRSRAGWAATGRKGARRARRVAICVFLMQNEGCGPMNHVAKGALWGATD